MKEIALEGDKLVASIFSTTVEVMVTSRKERLATKKYMGECRQWSPHSRRMIMVLPISKVTYMSRKVHNRRIPVARSV